MENLRVTITEELVDKAFATDPTLSELINPGVVKSFAGSTFTQTESGRGWRGAGGHYGNDTALGRVLVIATTPPDSKNPQQEVQK